ncbi:MAG: hypothetical protein QNJ71_06400 [Acidimicrobiia bacterium]|nr:hypothetical protein [Acidimicrobiia bacterium]
MTDETARTGDPDIGPEEDAPAPVGGRASGERDTFELLATVMLALAAIAIAWAGFQSSKWSGVQATSFSEAGAARTESVRASTRAGQEAQVDVGTFQWWLDSVVADIERGVIPEPSDSADYEPTPDTISGFVFERFRDEFRPAVDAWLSTSPFEDPAAPPTPFEMDEYVLADALRADELQDVAVAKAKDAATANQNSDNYVVSAVLFAIALFFAALSGKLRNPTYQTAALGVAAVVFAGTLIYVLSLPVEI